MRTTGKLLAITFALANFVFGLAFTGCTKDEATPSGTETLKTEALLNYSYSDTIPGAGDCVDSIQNQDLSPAETEALVMMREEEYLAFDVYTALSQIYSKPIFRNIAKSELRHTEAVKTLLLRYNLTDPAANHVPGVFSNTTLQTLYNTLVEQGSASLLQGVIVGATIEDMDIVDLKNHLKDVDNQDIITVFNNLMKGSRNHLRSFYRNIVFLGGTYSPQYLSQEDFNAIINSEHEIGPGS